MIGCISNGRPGRQLLLRVHHAVRAVAKQKLPLHIPGSPGDHLFRAQFLQIGGNDQGALKVIPDSHKAYVIVIYPQGTQKGFVGRVPDLRVGDQRQRVVDPLLVFVNGHHLMMQLVQLCRDMVSKASQTNQQNGFHGFSSFSLL